MTNGDKIRAMSNEELAELFKKREAECCFCTDYVDGACLNIYCKDGVMAYLNQEVTE